MENKLIKFLPKKNQWMMVLLIGVLLVIIAIPTTNTTDTSTDVYSEQNSLTTNTEKRLISMLEKMKGVGEASAMITDEGILIIAEGGGNAVVVQEITSVIKALFDMDTHKIKVIERK